ncbi:preprotein translocase subunit SecG [Methylovirgula sp. HY1]|uniref:preprotein translocase subunit SecG n=1 Tax=Methylovirgula sp. HY1 TaxID=2822761 RepID=UPI001C5ADC5E|nr:preprotein translocase subunit SecG [Methylovirgula sp. HY1]QXX73939.1 Protein-export membrane protein SecG [Methylovirgula sp. HY1]
MQTVLIVIHLMVVIALVAVVLLQRSEGGALGIGGGGFMTGRGQANVLTRATAILAALFFATSLALTILANWTRAPKSILQGVTPPASTSAPASSPAGKGNLLDQLKKLEQQRRVNQGAPAPSPAPAQPEAPRSQ